MRAVPQGWGREGGAHDERRKHKQFRRACVPLQLANILFVCQKSYRTGHESCHLWLNSCVCSSSIISRWTGRDGDGTLLWCNTHQNVTTDTHFSSNPWQPDVLMMHVTGIYRRRMGLLCVGELLCGLTFLFLNLEEFLYSFKNPWWCHKEVTWHVSGAQTGRLQLELPVVCRSKCTSQARVCQPPQTDVTLQCVVSQLLQTVDFLWEVLGPWLPSSACWGLVGVSVVSFWPKTVCVKR